MIALEIEDKTIKTISKYIDFKEYYHVDIKMDKDKKAIFLAKKSKTDTAMEIKPMIEVNSYDLYGELIESVYLPKYIESMTLSIPNNDDGEAFMIKNASLFIGSKG